MKINNKAFTLVELLVVVLIIGILTAIAVPQYQLAVDKADFMKYQSMLASLRDAYDEYVLLNGEGTKNFEDLSFTMPASFKNAGEYPKYEVKCVNNDNMMCCLRNYKYEYSDSYWGATAYCGKNDSDISVVYKEDLYDRKGNPIKRTRYCIAKKDNTRANRLCKSIGMNKTQTSLVKPSGVDRDYYQYTIN